MYLSFFFWRNSPKWATASSFLRFLDHTQRRTAVGRTPLYEWSARRRDLYLTTHNTHKRQTSMPPAGFEPTIPASEWLQTYALDRAATGTGFILQHSLLNSFPDFFITATKNGFRRIIFKNSHPILDSRCT